MAQRRRKRSKRWVSRLLILILIIVAGVVCYFVWDAYFRNSGKDTTEKKDEAEIVEKTDTDRIKEPTKEEVKEVRKEEVVQYDGNNPNEGGQLTGVVTYAGVSGDYLMIRVNIDQYLTSGRCALTLQQTGTEVYNEEVNLVDSASTSTCEGFNVPMSKLGAGKVTILINLYSGNKTGVINGETEI